MDEKEKRKGMKIIVAALMLSEILVLFLLLTSFSEYAIAVVGSPNATVQTLLTVGNAYPEVLNITINSNSNINLVPNSTYPVEVVAIVRDYNGDTDLSAVRMEFFDVSSSSIGAADDNNRHYTNNTCLLNISYGDSNEGNATCTFNVWYYANNATWTAYVAVNDSTGAVGTLTGNRTINSLLALGLPDFINYSTVNATQVSSEQIANVTNMGNVVTNLSLSGYGATVGDGNAMNCTQGSTKNISIYYEKYNLTTSNPGEVLNLAQFEAANFTNLTSAVATKRFNIAFRQNDTAAGFDDTNSTYWRIYVPIGVAGSCSGNIVFGATRGTGT